MENRSVSRRRQERDRGAMTTASHDTPQLNNWCQNYTKKDVARRWGAVGGEIGGGCCHDGSDGRGLMGGELEQPKDRAGIAKGSNEKVGEGWRTGASAGGGGTVTGEP